MDMSLPGQWQNPVWRSVLNWRVQMCTHNEWNAGNCRWKTTAINPCMGNATGSCWKNWVMEVTVFYPRSIKEKNRASLQKRWDRVKALFGYCRKGVATVLVPDVIKHRKKRDGKLHKGRTGEVIENRWKVGMVVKAGQFPRIQQDTVRPWTGLIGQMMVLSSQTHKAVYQWGEGQGPLSNGCFNSED